MDLIKTFKDTYLASTEDPVLKAINAVEKKIRLLEGGVEQFSGPHFNLKYRQFKEKCIRYQMELDSLRGLDEISDGKRRKALGRIIEIENRLFAKMHAGESCPECS
jgi:hypothetical protein